MSVILVIYQPLLPNLHGNQQGHPNLEVFLSQLESDLFKVIERPLGYSNRSKEEWDAIRSLADDKNS